MWLFIAPILIVIAVAVAVSVATSNPKPQLRRVSSIARVARDLGWTFKPNSDFAHASKFGHLPLFSEGIERRGFNTMTGWTEVDGRRYLIRIGDYECVITTPVDDDEPRAADEDPKVSTTPRRFSYLLILMPFRDTPRLRVRPEQSLDRIIGRGDINFESVEFSRAFHVTSVNRKFAYGVLHPRMMELLLSTREANIDIHSATVCVSMGEKMWTAEEFDRWARWAAEFVALWPSYLASEAESDQQP